MVWTLLFVWVLINERLVTNAYQTHMRIPTSRLLHFSPTIILFVVDVSMFLVIHYRYKFFNVDESTYIDSFGFCITNIVKWGGVQLEGLPVDPSTILLVSSGEETIVCEWFSAFFCTSPPKVEKKNWFSNCGGCNKRSYW